MATCSVNIESTTQTSFGDTMSDIRTWLDNKKIEPVEFKTIPGAGSTVSLTIRFATEVEAILFEQEFADGRCRQKDRR